MTQNSSQKTEPKFDLFVSFFMLMMINQPLSSLRGQKKSYLEIISTIIRS